ncbi:MAG TPA: hypothetical protein VNY52_06075 [Solirubrobacteraceae bacterium]|nr:hypothetical protein [Solirubrobacteraceae bacterium]
MHWGAFRRYLTYANVTATLALVFAMSGGALAAKHYLINSTGQINPKVLKKLRGRTGLRGIPGVEGPTGPAGPAGPGGAIGGSKAFNTNSGEGILSFSPLVNTPETVATLSLPAGKFSVVGKLIAENDESSNEPYIVRCELLLGKTLIDSGYSGVALGEGGKVPPQANRHYLVLAGDGSLSSPGTAEIVCKVHLDGVESGPPAAASGKYMDRSITAIQVGSLG